MLTILFSALSGALVSLILPYLLFYPKKPLHIGSLTLQGAVPQASSKVMRDLPQWLKSQGVEQKLVETVASADLSEEAAPLIDEKLELFFGDIVNQVPMAAMFLKGNVAETLKGQAKEKLLELMPELQRRAGERVAQSMDLPALLESQIDVEAVTSKGEQMLQQKRGVLCLFGATIGACVGIVQLLVV